MKPVHGLQNTGESSLALPISTEEMKQRQRSEVEALSQEISEEEKARFQALKQKALDEAFGW